MLFFRTEISVEHLSFMARAFIQKSIPDPVEVLYVQVDGEVIDAIVLNQI